MGITVDELLQEPFANRTLSDQIRIIVERKPRPVLNMSAVTVGDDGMITTKNFEPAIYDQVLWLTGSEIQQSFFCWPCLLYMQGPVWKVDSLAFLSEGIAKHKTTPQHVQASLHFKKFVMQHLNTQKLNMDECKFNEMIQRNRDSLKFLIDSTISIVIKEQPHKQSEGQCRIKSENCVRILKFQRNYVGLLASQIDHAIKLIQVCPTLLDDLVDTITEVFMMTVKKEVQKSTFVSIIFSEHSLNSSKSQISTVLRYIKNGKVCERFVGFTNILEKKSANVIKNFVLSMIQKFEISGKLLSYSFDAAILNAHELSEVINFLEREYSYSYFVPSYFHELFYIFQQSLAACKECRLFFRILDGMKAYFVNSSVQWKAFEAYMLGKLPLQRNSKWIIKEPFVIVVNSCRKYFIDFFDSIVQNCTKWNANDVTSAHGFQLYLKEFCTIFLLEVFTSIIKETEKLDEALKSNALENAFGSDMGSIIVKNLSTLKETGFESIFNHAIQGYGNPDNQESKRFKTNSTEIKDHYRELYNNILNVLIQEILLRFNSLDKLEFCGMLNKENGMHVIEDSGLNAFFNYYLTYLDDQKHDFDLERMKNEVKVMRMNNKLFADKNVYDLLDFLTDLKGAFKNVNKLTEFILTMPFKPPSLNTVSSKFETIQNSSYSADSLIVSGDISVLNVESDHLKDIKSSFFYDDVISKFFQVNKSIQLILQNH